LKVQKGVSEYYSFTAVDHNLGNVILAEGFGENESCWDATTGLGLAAGRSVGQLS